MPGEGNEGSALDLKENLGFRAVCVSIVYPWRVTMQAARPSD